MSFKPTADQKEATKLFNDVSLRHIMLYGGSRSGKTLLTIFIIFLRALKTKSRHAILRKAFNHAKQSLCYDTIPKMLEICFPQVPVKLDKTDWYYELPNGSTIWIGGLDDKDRVEKILGNEYSTVYLNECSQISWHAVEMVMTRLAEKTGLRNMAYYDENPPSKRHWSYKLFIEGINPDDGSAINLSKYSSMLMNPQGNIENLPDDYIETLQSLSSRQRRRFLSGLFSDDSEGALWKNKYIDDHRISREKFDEEIEPKIKYIVVSVDPSVTNNENSDDAGINVSSISTDGHYYVLDDYTLKGTPLQWGQEVIRAYDDWQANKIVGEVNNGGDLIQMNLNNIRRGIPFKAVRATKGKAIRAEPIVALYEQGLVHHVGTHEELENEMTTWNPITDKLSPGRLDSLVWGITYLSAPKKTFSSRVF